MVPSAKLALVFLTTKLWTRDLVVAEVNPAIYFRGIFMGWFLILILFVAGVPIFTWSYRRHLDVLTGPWIANEISRND